MHDQHGNPLRFRQSMRAYYTPMPEVPLQGDDEAIDTTGTPIGSYYPTQLEWPVRGAQAGLGCPCGSGERRGVGQTEGSGFGWTKVIVVLGVVGAIGVGAYWLGARKAKTARNPARRQRRRRRFDDGEDSLAGELGVTS